MEYDNLLNVPLKHQIDGDVIQSFFPFIESFGVSYRECKACKSQISADATKTDLKKHLFGHARVVQDERIKNFERSQEELGKLICKCCRGEFKIPYAIQHAKACDGQKKIYYNRRGKAKCERQDNKRLFDEVIDVNDSERVKKEEEHKIEKKVKKDFVFTSFSGREDASFNNQLYGFILEHKHLGRRALKLKIKEFTEPFEKKWLQDKTVLQLELYKLQRDQDKNKLERDKQVEELQAKIAAIEAEKEEMQKLVKDSVRDCETTIKLELQQEMEERIEQSTMSWRRELLEVKSMLSSKSDSMF